MFNLLILFSFINQSILNNNYYIDNIPKTNLSTYNINCNITKDINQNKFVKEIIKNDFKKSIKKISKEIEKCKDKKCVKSIVKMEWNRIYGNFDDFNTKQKQVLINSFYFIKFNNIGQDKILNYILKDNELITEIGKSSKFSISVIKKENKNLSITNKNFLTIIKQLYLDKSINHFKINCKYVSPIHNTGKSYKLVPEIFLQKDTDKNEILSIIKDNTKLYCDRESKICYSISYYEDIINNLKETYLSGYDNNFTGNVIYFKKNKDLILNSKIEKIKINKKKINLIYKYFDNFTTLSGNNLIIKNITGAEEKLKKIVDSKYGKDLYILSKYIDKYGNYKPIINNAKSDKETGQKENKNIKINNIEIKEKIIKKNKKDIKKIVEDTGNVNYMNIIIGVFGFLIIVIIGGYMYIRKKVLNK